MIPDEPALRRLFASAADRAADYRSADGSRPQRPQIGYEELRARAGIAATPDLGSPAEQVIAELGKLASPGLHATTGPRFFGWVIGGSHPVGVAADWLTSAWGQTPGNVHVSPAGAVVEEIAARWLLDLLELPRDASVGFVTGATMANFTCLAAARSALLAQQGWDVESRGLFRAPEIPVLIGADAHTTVFAALQMLGLGHERVRRVPTDPAGRIIAAEFVRLLDETEGPPIAIAQAGQINTGAFDPIGAVAPAVRARGGWLHVDGAFGLWARACPTRAHLTGGIELADSWATDGHKWLQTPYDCGYAIVARPPDHRRAMTAVASYLPAAGDDGRDPSHYVPELSRRARGFATWAVIAHLGRRGIAEMVERHCALARRFAERLASEPGIAVLNEVELNQVIVQFGTEQGEGRADELTASVIRRIQEDGVCFVGGARWRGRLVMRLSVISWSTGAEDVERSAAAIIDVWRAIQRSM